MKESRRHNPIGSQPHDSGLPPGTPAWITPELVAQTLEVWQPYYETPLSVEEAVAMIKCVGRLFSTSRQK